MRISDWSSDVCSSDLSKRPLYGRRISGCVGRGEAHGEISAEPGCDGRCARCVVSICAGGRCRLDQWKNLYCGCRRCRCHGARRSEERRGGKECGSKCSSRWSPYY